MIYGIGTDIVDIRRILQSIEKNPSTFAQRILTPFEFQIFEQKQQQSVNLASAYLAKRFAAKEAFVKALGTGFSQGLSLQHIEVFNDEFGKPGINCFEKAQKLLVEKSLMTHLSLSDEKNYAIAYVILSTT